MRVGLSYAAEGRGRHLLRALRSRNYRLFVAGQGISLIGTWMQQVAMGWLVYRLTGSAMMLGLLGFTSQIPILPLAPLAGVLADRWDRRRLLLATQSLALVQATLLAFVVLTGLVQIWHLIVLSLLLGVSNSFDIPVRQSFVVEMVELREDLGNAIALNSSMFNAARLIGPAIAGLLLSAFGEGVCFLINSLSYLAIIAALIAMRIAPNENSRQRKHVYHELREGLSYAFGFGPIRSILTLVALVSLLGMPYSVLMPLFAGQVHKGNANTYGLFLSAIGAGAVCGTLYLASRKTVLGLGGTIVRSAALFGGGIALFALSRSLFLALPALVVSGFGVTTMFAACNTILQTIVEEDKRGRVMSFYVMAFSGMIPFGSLIAGSLASWIGARETVLLGGAFSLAGAAYFARKLPGIRTMVRPVYQRMGILPDVSEPIDTVVQ